MTKATSADVARLYQVQAQIKELQLEEADLKESIKETLEPDRYTIEHNGKAFDLDLIAKRSTFNKVLFARDYPYRDNPEYYSFEVQPKAVAALLGEDEADNYYSHTVALTLKEAKELPVAVGEL